MITFDFAVLHEFSGCHLLEFQSYEGSRHMVTQVFGEDQMVPAMSGLLFQYLSGIPDSSDAKCMDHQLCDISKLSISQGARSQK
jgi:hypothetical protein